MGIGMLTLKEQCLKYYIDNNDNETELKGITKICFSCGAIDLPLASYHFHHWQGKKKRNISQMILGKSKMTWEILDELQKCISLCANCHNVETIQKLDFLKHPESFRASLKGKTEIFCLDYTQNNRRD